MPEPTLQGRLCALGCPDPCQSDIGAGEAAGWPLLYRMPSGRISPAWVDCDPAPAAPGRPFLLVVKSPDFEFAFAPDGSIARARYGKRFAIAESVKEKLFHRFLGVLTGRESHHGAC